MKMSLHGPRQIVLKSRRVCLPSAITDDLQWVKGKSAVVVRIPKAHQGELVVELVPGSPKLTRSRDPDRPRRLDEQGQVTIPAGLMKDVGLGRDQAWVYFARVPRQRAVRIIPQPLALAAWAEGAL